MLRICRLANSKNSIHVLFRQERRQPMAKLVLEFSDEEKMREKGSRALDVSKSTGVMT